MRDVAHEQMRVGKFLIVQYGAVSSTSVQRSKNEQSALCQ